MNMFYENSAPILNSSWVCRMVSGGEVGGVVTGHYHVHYWTRHPTRCRFAFGHWSFHPASVIFCILVHKDQANKILAEYSSVLGAVINLFYYGEEIGWRDSYT